MKLKSRIKADEFEKLADPLKECYTKQSDGDYELDADVEQHSTVRGMRTTMTKSVEESKKAREARKSLLEKLGIEDSDEADAKIEEYLALKADAEKQRGKKMLDEGKVAELVAEQVNTQVGAMKKDHDKQIKAVVAERDSFRNLAERGLVDSALSQALDLAGAKAKTKPFLLLKGKETYRLVGDKVVAMDGDKPLFGKDGTTPLSMSEWAEQQREAADVMFEASTGGGANGGTTKQLPGAFQLTREQARDTALYRTTKEAAEKVGKEVVILPQ